MSTLQLSISHGSFEGAAWWHGSGLGLSSDIPVL